MRSGTGHPWNGPKGQQSRYTGIWDLQEVLNYLGSSVGCSLAGLGIPQKGSYLEGLDLGYLGTGILDIPGMAQRANRADIQGYGISRIWMLGP